jgi:hypothetical protein
MTDNDRTGEVIDLRTRPGFQVSAWLRSLATSYAERGGCVTLPRRSSQCS